MKLDRIFHRSPVAVSRRSRQEPRFGRIARQEETETGYPEDDEAFGDEAEAEPTLLWSVSPRNMSPRQMADWAQAMYLAKAFSWEEYSLAGFPAELHPDYNRTVGMLTGRSARPDEARDMVKDWEERLAFALRYNPPIDAAVRRTKKILTELRRL